LTMESNRSLIELGAPLPPARLVWTTGAPGLVVFAHGGGEPRSHDSVEARLQARPLGTLRLNLLSPADSVPRSDPAHVDLLTQRLLQALDALVSPTRPAAQVPWQGLPIGLMASGIDVAACLRAAAQRPALVRALVSRAGRLDLAADVLGDVRAATLVLVGAADPERVEISRTGYLRLRGEKRIDLVPRATRQFLEAGTLDDVAQRAGDWFSQHLGGPP
jgi:putative phosphoribosyl transferase